MTDHECVFAEEMEPSARLILAPCLICGLTALDALERLRTDIRMWRDTAEGLVRDMRALASDFAANGNSRPLGELEAHLWHKASQSILDRLARS